MLDNMISDEELDKLLKSHEIVYSDHNNGFDRDLQPRMISEILTVMMKYDRPNYMYWIVGLDMYVIMKQILPFETYKTELSYLGLGVELANTRNIYLVYPIEKKMAVLEDLQ